MFHLWSFYGAHLFLFPFFLWFFRCPWKAGKVQAATIKRQNAAAVASFLCIGCCSNLESHVQVFWSVQHLEGRGDAAGDGDGDGAEDAVAVADEELRSCCELAVCCGGISQHVGGNTMCHVQDAICNVAASAACCLHNSRCVLHVVNVKRGSNFGGVQVFHLSICASLRFICPLFVMPFIAAMLVVRCLDVVAIAVKCLFTLRLVALGSGVSTEKKLKTMLKLKTENWIPKIQNQANAPPFPLRRWEVVVATAHILIYGLPSAAGFFYVRYAIHIIMLDTVGWSNRFDI